MTFEEKWEIMTSDPVGNLIGYVSSFDSFSGNFVNLMDDVHVTVLKRLAEYLEDMQKAQNKGGMQ